MTGVGPAGSLMEQGEPSTVGVLLVDDQASFRSAVRDLVAATDGFVLLGEADSGEAAVDAVELLFPPPGDHGQADARHGRHRGHPGAYGQPS